MQTRFLAWRAEVEAWHPFPDADAALLYLVSEIGEACDAVAFTRRPGDDRTNHKARDLGRELAQIVDMAYAVAIRHGIDLDAEVIKWMDVVRQRGDRSTEAVRLLNELKVLAGHMGGDHG